MEDELISILRSKMEAYRVEDSMPGFDSEAFRKRLLDSMAPVNEQLQREAIEAGWYDPVHGVNYESKNVPVPRPKRREVRPLYIVRYAAAILLGTMIGGAIVWRLTGTRETRIVVVHEGQSGSPSTQPSSTEVLIADSRSKNEPPRRMPATSGQDSAMQASPDKYWHPAGVPKTIDTALRIAIQEGPQQQPAYPAPYVRPQMLSQAAPVRAENYRHLMMNPEAPYQRSPRPVQPPPVFTASLYVNLSDKPL